MSKDVREKSHHIFGGEEIKWVPFIAAVADNVFSEGQKCPRAMVLAAMKTVPLSQAKEELMELMPRQRQLLFQVGEHHTTAICKSKKQGLAWVLIRNLNKNFRKSQRFWLNQKNAHLGSLWKLLKIFLWLLPIYQSKCSSEAKECFCLEEDEYKYCLTFKQTHFFLKENNLLVFIPNS